MTIPNLIAALLLWVYAVSYLLHYVTPGVTVDHWFMNTTTCLAFPVLAGIGYYIIKLLIDKLDKD